MNAVKMTMATNGATFRNLSRKNRFFTEASITSKRAH